MNPSSATSPTESPAPSTGDDEVCAAIERSLIESFAHVFHTLGLPRSYGQIFGLAFVSAAPVSFEDVVANLGLSKGSASQGMKWLRETGLLIAATDFAPAGGGKARREFYEPVLDLGVLLRVVVKERLERPLDSGARRLSSLQELLDTGAGMGNRSTRSKVAHLRRRLQQLRKWHLKTTRFAPALVRLTG